MKKFISILLLTAVVSTSVFAVPFNAALLNIENAAANTQEDFDDFDVEGTELTEAEMSEAEGEGLFGFIFAVVFGAVSNVATGYVQGKVQNTPQSASSYALSAVLGGGTGGLGYVISLFLPF